MLIDLLWESLDEARMRGIETNWAAESEDRIDAYERGELPAVDGPAALQDLRSSLRKLLLVTLSSWPQQVEVL